MVTRNGIIPLARALHLLGICAWIGGGLGVLLLLVLDGRTGSAEELQAFNRVIDAIDDWIIAPGAITSLLSGLVLARLRRLRIHACPFLGLKFYGATVAVVYGLCYVAPRLELLLFYAQRDTLAVFDDRLYNTSYVVGVAASAVQSVLVLGLLAVSVVRPRSDVIAWISPVLLRFARQIRTLLRLPVLRPPVGR